MILAVHVARMVMMGRAHNYFFLPRRVYEGDCLRGLNVEGWVIQELNKKFVRIWTRFIWLRIGYSGGLLCETDAASC